MTTHVYFRVPGHYGYGPEFDTFVEAEAHALSTIRPIEGTERVTRAFVDVRVSDDSGDRPVHRIEIKKVVLSYTGPNLCEINIEEDEV